jgi:hypothetical protein
MTETAVFNISTLPQPERQKIRDAIREIDAAWTRAEAERDLVKATLTKLNEEIGVDKKVLRKLAKTYHKSSYDTEVEENKMFEEAYEVLLK